MTPGWWRARRKPGRGRCLHVGSPEAFHSLVRVTVPVSLSSMAGASLVTWQFAATSPAVDLGGWWAAFVCVGVLRIGLAWACLKGASRVMGAPPARSWVLATLAAALAHAALWGACSTMLMTTRGSAEAESLLHMVLAAVTMGAAVHLSAHYPVLVAYVLMAGMPLAWRDALIGGQYHLVLGLTSVLIMAYALLNGRTQARMLGELFSRRRRHDRMMAALRRENLRHEQARREAEAAHNAKVRFFASVNHDLRQPLNALGLLAQTLQEAHPAEPTRTIAHHLVACVEGMGQVVDELLGLARLEATTLAPQPTTWALSDVLHEVARTFEPLARAKGLALTVQVDPPCRVCCDRALLSRVLGNLVSNAIRYTAQGSVRLEAQDDGQAVALRVVDTGIGIAPQHLPHIFEEFYQVGHPQRDRRAGLGLGLATVKRLSLLMGLQVEVHSVVGQGSCFAMALPRAPVQAGGPLPAAAQERPAAPGARMSCRVLVVDDDADSREALRGLLEAWGCDVQAVPAVAGAQRAFSAGWRPDVMVADMHLDQAACGLAAVRAVRARWHDARLPALLVTGDVGSDRMREAQAQGYTVLTKPIKAVRLRAFMNQALAGRVERRLAVRVVAG